MPIVLLICSSIFSLSFSIYSESLSVFVFLCLALLAGGILCSWNSRNSLETDYARRAFFASFALYTLCAFFAVGYYRSCGDEFRFVIDQNSFLKHSYLAAEEGSFWGIFKDTYFTHASLWKDIALFRCLQGFVAHIAENYLDGNKAEVLIAFSVGVSSYIPIFLFKILAFRFSVSDALKFTVIFSFFSYLLYHSPLIIRDVPVLLAYTIAFWLFFLSFSWSRLFGMIIIMVSCFSLRPESGLLFLPFLGMYIKEKMNGNPWQLMVYAFVFLGGAFSLLFLGNQIFSFVGGFAETALGYVEFTAEGDMSRGMAQYIAVLPPVIREFVRILNGLFPVVTLASTIRMFFSGGYSWWDIGHLSLLCIGHVFLLILSLKCCANIPRIWSYLRKDSIIFACFIGTIVLLLGNSFSYAHRRVLFAYLFLYVLFLFATKSRPFLKK